MNDFESPRDHQENPFAITSATSLEPPVAPIEVDGVALGATRRRLALILLGLGLLITAIDVVAWIVAILSMRPGDLLIAALWGGIAAGALLVMTSIPLFVVRTQNGVPTLRSSLIAGLLTIAAGILLVLLAVGGGIVLLFVTCVAIG